MANSTIENQHQSKFELKRFKPSPGRWKIHSVWNFRKIIQNTRTCASEYFYRNISDRAYWKKRFIKMIPYGKKHEILRDQLH